MRISSLRRSKQCHLRSVLSQKYMVKNEKDACKRENNGFIFYLSGLPPGHSKRQSDPSNLSNVFLSDTQSNSYFILISLGLYLDFESMIFSISN